MPSSTFLAASFSFIERSCSTTDLAFSRAAFLAFLGVDRLEHLCHQLHLGARCDREHIAVKVDGTSLVLGFGEYFSHSLQHTEAFVSDHQFNPIQTTAMQLLEEADPTGLVLFHTLGGAKNLTVSYYSLLFSTHTKKGNSHPKRMIVSFFK